MKKKIANRCLFIEGIGRVHVVGRPGRWDCAAIDHDLPRQFILGMLAADIVNGKEPGKVMWAVRFQEKAA